MELESAERQPADSKLGPEATLLASVGLPDCCTCPWPSSGDTPARPLGLQDGDGGPHIAEQLAGQIASAGASCADPLRPGMLTLAPCSSG